MPSRHPDVSPKPRFTKFAPTFKERSQARSLKPESHAVLPFCPSGRSPEPGIPGPVSGSVEQQRGSSRSAARTPLTLRFFAARKNPPAAVLRAPHAILHKTEAAAVFPAAASLCATKSSVYLTPSSFEASLFSRQAPVFSQKARMVSSQARVLSPRPRVLWLGASRGWL